MKKTGIKASSFIFYSVFCLLFLSGCGGGSNPVSTLAETPLPKPIAPVTVSGTLATTLDSSVDKTALKVSTLNSSASLSSDGSFSAQINNQSYDFVTLSKDGTNPVALAVTVPGTTAVQLDATSTAKSIIFFTTFFSNPDEDSINNVVTEISSLIEVTSLAQELEPNIKKGLDISSTLTQTAKDLIKQATNKVLAKLSSSAKEKVTTTLTSPSSGFSMSILDDTNASQTKIQFQNTAKRHINVVVTDCKKTYDDLLLGPGQSLTGSSLGGLFDGSYKPIQESPLLDLSCGGGNGSAFGPGLSSSTQNRGLSYFEAFSRTFLSLSTAPISLMLTAMYGSSDIGTLIAKKGGGIIEGLHKRIKAIMTANNIIEKAKTDMPGAVWDLTYKLATDPETYKGIAEVLETTISDDAAKQAAAKVNVAGAVWDIMMAVYNFKDLDEQVSFYLTATAAKLTSISIYTIQDPPLLEVGRTVSLKATGKYDDNTTQDITSQLTWKVDDTTKALFTSSTDPNIMVLEGKAEGQVKVWAEATGTSGYLKSNEITLNVTSSSGNQSPTATLSADKTSGAAPLTVTFTIGYTDPEGAAGTYSLDYGDSTTAATGSINSGATTTAQHTYSSASTYTATLAVTDDKGATGTGSVNIDTTGTNQAPQCTLTADKTSGTAPLAVSFTATCTDADGNLQGVKCPDGTDIPPSIQICPQSPCTSTATACSGAIPYYTITANNTTNFTYTTAGTYTATASITDAAGAQGTSTGVTITVSASGGGTKTAQKVAGGRFHTCALLSDGTVKCWGQNDYGQIGNGTTTNSTTPISILSNAIAISVGQIYTCAVLSDGSGKCWGYGYGNSPISVSGIANARNIAAGLYHTCVLLSDGSVKCWGDNGGGKLGDGTTTNSSSPVSVIGISTATSITVGQDHSCALLSDGVVKCWGGGLYGQIGTYTDSSIPVSVPGITNATDVAAGLVHTCALLSDGTVKCWGYNAEGELGDGTKTNSSTPMSVVSINNATSIGTGWGYNYSYNGQHTCAVLSDGSIKCWGRNKSGEIGDGTYTNATTPIPVSGINTAKSVGGGSSFTCATLLNGSVKCWGNNSYGQLGNGTTTGSSTPVSVSDSLYALSPWTQFKNLVLFCADTIKRTLAGALWN